MVGRISLVNSNCCFVVVAVTGIICIPALVVMAGLGRSVMKDSYLSAWTPVAGHQRAVNYSCIVVKCPPRSRHRGWVVLCFWLMPVSVAIKL